VVGAWIRLRPGGAVPLVRFCLRFSEDDPLADRAVVIGRMT